MGDYEPLNPVAVEQAIQEVRNRIAEGVRIVTDRETAAKAAKRAFDEAYALAYGRAEGSIKDREYAATIETMALREAADTAQIAFRHAERRAEQLNKDLFALLGINNTVRAMFNAAGVS